MIFGTKVFYGVLMRHELALRKLTEYVARKAALLNQKYEVKDLVSPSIAPMMDKAIDKIVLTVSRRNGGLWCNLCEKRSFHKKGILSASYKGSSERYRKHGSRRTQQAVGGFE